MNVPGHTVDRMVAAQLVKVFRKQDVNVRSVIQGVIVGRAVASQRKGEQTIEAVTYVTPRRN